MKYAPRSKVFWKYTVARRSVRIHMITALQELFILVLDKKL